MTYRYRDAISRRTWIATTGCLAGTIVAPGLFAKSKFPSDNVFNDNEESAFKEFTAESRKSIDRGTRWLLKAFNSDGGAGPDIGTPTDVACSAVAGMALLSQGHTPTEGKHSKQSEQVCRFLLKRVAGMGLGGALQTRESQIEGDLGPLASHFFVMLYLSQAFGESRNVKPFLESLSALEQFVSSGQLDNGSWGTDAWAPMLSTACGWLSLRAASFAGIKVSGSSENAGNYILRHMPKLGLQWSQDESWYHRLYGTAAGLRVLYALNREKEKKAVQALEDILGLLESNPAAFGGAGGEEYLTFHLLTEMMLQQGGKKWKRWYPTVRDKLIKVQNKDGSWTGHHCITSRTFSTACALMVLSAPNRYLPISQG